MTTTNSLVLSFDLISEMEDEICAVEDYTFALSRIAEGLATDAKQDGRLLQRIAISMQSHCKAIKDRRATISHLLRGSRFDETDV